MKDTGHYGNGGISYIVAHPARVLCWPWPTWPILQLSHTRSCTDANNTR